ncbi:hypothetical protein [Budvicia aquatica]|uniref:hypothetical protein n=1 Tax=Budvicia aquatica TaxID=82979 RepID=UPI000FD97A85|nr:hypothetical protein [Budvicia aquatica]
MSPPDVPIDALPLYLQPLAFVPVGLLAQSPNAPYPGCGVLTCSAPFSALNGGTWVALTVVMTPHSPSKSPLCLVVTAGSYLSVPA